MEEEKKKEFRHNESGRGIVEYLPYKEPAIIKVAGSSESEYKRAIGYILTTQVASKKVATTVATFFDRPPKRNRKRLQMGTPSHGGNLFQYGYFQNLF